jgi:hypothetical protein
VRRALLLLLAALAGCGNDVTPPPETQAPDPPRGTREVELDKAGVGFIAPFNWPDLDAQGLRVGGIQNKRATVAVWRYERIEPLPASRAQLERAEDRLIERVEQRDPSFELRNATNPRRDGARSIELVGRQTIAGLAYGVRSAHVFHDGAEIVVDAYAPAEHFERVDATVFRPLLDSLELS